jgi:hypothetical protein
MSIWTAIPIVAASFFNSNTKIGQFFNFELEAIFIIDVSLRAFDWFSSDSWDIIGFRDLKKKQQQTAIV